MRLQAIHTSGGDELHALITMDTGTMEAPEERGHEGTSITHTWTRVMADQIERWLGPRGRRALLEAKWCAPSALAV